MKGWRCGRSRDAYTLRGGPGCSSLVMSEFDPLRRYFESKAPFTANDLDFLEELFVPVRLEPGAFLQRAGEPVRHAAFVAKGCLRSYVVDANGEEGDPRIRARELVDR